MVPKVVDIVESKDRLSKQCLGKQRWVVTSGNRWQKFKVEYGNSCKVPLDVLDLSVAFEFV